VSRVATFLTVFVLPILLVGCPFESKVPIAQPGAPLDVRLVGLWMDADPSDPDSTRLLILPFNATEYYAELREKDNQVMRFRAFPFALEKEPYLHIDMLNPAVESASFFVARYSISDGGVLALNVVGDDAVPDSLQADAKALIAFLIEHRNDPGLKDADTSLEVRRIAP